MTSIPAPPNVPAPEALYDWIMGHIEPELVRANLPNLSAKYATESEAGKAARAERYTAAFAEYDRLLTEYVRMLNEQVNTYKRTAYQTIEAQHVEEDAEALGGLFAFITAI